MCRIITYSTVHGKYKHIYTFEGFYLHQLILWGIWKLLMEAVLQNFCYVSHAITTCKTQKHWWDIKRKTTCIHVLYDKWYSKLIPGKTKAYICLIDNCIISAVMMSFSVSLYVFILFEVFCSEHDQTLAPSSGIYSVQQFLKCQCCFVWFLFN